MRSVLRNSWRFFALLTAAAVGLRLFFLLEYPNWDGDARLYGDMAKNWLQHGILGTSGANGVQPSLIRLPGYPAFLAAIWAFTGVEHYRAVLIVQLLIDVGTCFVVADMVRRILRSDRAARIAFLLAAVCPFTANYVACALTETLAIFLAALALDLAAIALESDSALRWAACGAAIGGGILLRPDGGILLPVICVYIGGRSWSRSPSRDLRSGIKALSAAMVPVLVVTGMALAPLAPWAIRNWRAFHVLQPLAPRYANDPGQFVPMGFERWMKTWIADYVSVAEIYWQMGEDKISLDKAPRRAFDSNQERQAVQALFDRYNSGPRHEWTPELDSSLARIAQARIARHPFRYYALLPAVRIADMWLRPRTEMLGVDDRWWEPENFQDSYVAICWGAINLFYVVAALGGLGWLVLHRPTRLKLQPQYWGLGVMFLATRSLFLGTLENPEPRYTLECYPALIVFATAALVAMTKKSVTRRSIAASAER